MVEKVEWDMILLDCYGCGMVGGIAHIPSLYFSLFENAR
jgi:hypothetical protein